MTGARRRPLAALLAAALIVLVLVVAPESAYSAGGALDTTFNTTGAAALDFDNGSEVVNDLVLQADGKPVVVGRTSSGFGMARYTTAGLLDTTFSTDGWLTSNAFMTDARAVAMQADSKPVVVGRSAATNGALTIARYTTVGVLDTTFDVDGWNIVTMTGAGSGGLDVAVHTDGKIVVLALDNGALSVFRYTTAGVLDTTFSGDGRVDTGAVSSGLNRIAVQADGKIVLTSGTAGSAGGVLRLNVDGTPDATYGTAGSATATDHVANGIVVQADGKTVIAGDQGSAGTGVLVARRNTDGSLDATFGTAGVTTFAVPGLTRSAAWGVALQSDGKVVVTGRLDDTPTSSTVFVARLTALGVLDTTFATNGIATFSSMASRATSGAHAIAVDSTGRFVVGGAVVGASSDTDFLVARILAADATTSTTSGSSTTSSSSTTTTTRPGQIAAGATARSDPADTTPTPSNEIVATVTTPVAGVVSFVKGDGTAVAGYRTLAGVTITAPTATAAAPLRIDFQVDVTGMPATFPLGGIEILRNDLPVARCTSATAAVPDPCVVSRTRSGDTMSVRVLSSAASTWKFARPILQRIAGESRVESAIAVSQTLFGDDAAGAVVLVRSDGFADALAATPLAVAKDAPLLLSDPSALDDATLVEIIRVLRPGGKVYLLGGTGALSDAVADRLLDWGFTIERLAGTNRYETAVTVARQGLGSPDVVVETTGLGFADALAAGAVAAHLGGAVLLTAGSQQTAATLAYIAQERPTRHALGGPAALADQGATAVAGANRYETAVLAALRFFPTIDAIGFASGTSFPDALAGGTHAGHTGAPLLLVPATGALPISIDILLRSEAAAPPAAYLYGGTSAIDEAIATTLRTALGG